MSELDYPFSDAPAVATGLEVVDGIHWLRLPLPFVLDHINVWLLDDGDGWTLVDTGVSKQKTRDAWEQLFSSQLQGKPIRRIIITHFHPDHFGLSKWISEHYQVAPQATLATQERAEYMLQTDAPAEQGPITGFYRSHGIDAPMKFADFATGQSYREIVSGLPAEMSVINDNDKMIIAGKSWRAIICNGHAQGHLSLYCEELDLLISGDQILPSITSNISLHGDNPDADPLRDYLQSLNVFLALPETTLVLPSHGRIFRGLHRRAAAIETHHNEKLEQTYSYCNPPRTAAEVAKLLFPQQLDELNWILAFGESLAHLRYLERRQEIDCSFEQDKYYFQQ
ncbi:MAG: MBL fold metallo-hydrolase [Gammaproteobacteria bacterium]